MLPDLRDMMAELLVTMGVECVTSYRGGSCELGDVNCFEGDGGDEEDDARVKE